MVELENEIKALIIASLDLEDVNVEDINSKAALFGDGLGLDSIDALELGLALKNKYNLRLSSDSEDVRQHFMSVETLAKFISNESKSSG